MTLRFGFGENLDLRIIINSSVKITVNMEIKVLGPGCAKCRKTYKVVEKVVAENNIDASLDKVEDIVEMMSYNIITTPAVVVDGVVRIKGYVPTEAEVKKVLGL